MNTKISARNIWYKWIYSIIIFLAVISFFSCRQSNNRHTEEPKINDETEVSPKVDILIAKPDSIAVPEGMVWVSGVRFTQGAQAGDELALEREKPAHPVAINGFFIDITEVTNRQFKKFVNETGYVTVAEREINWEDMKKQLPPNTPKPPDSVLQPGSLLFKRNVKNVTTLNDYSQWWEWKIGANWKQPLGPQSDLTGKDDYPAVHISYEDAIAYCNWAGRRLPTEAEWEAAAHGKMHGGVYTWGDTDESLSKNANTWNGEFPIINKGTDGFGYAAPIKSFPPNSLGIYDLAGNVWEWTQDWYSTNYYSKALAEGEVLNPTGPSEPYNPDNPYQSEKVIKGGSFLCNKSYCASYRVSARMGQTLDSASDHVGFRTVVTVKMLSEN